MKQWALWLPLLVAPIDGAWAINKCTNKDGTVSFQDAPCPREAESKALEIKVAPPASRGPSGRAGDSGPNSASPLPTPDRGDPRAVQAARAAGDLEALAFKARDCRNQLAFGGNDVVETCQSWARQAQDQIKPALATLRELSNDADFRQRHRLYFDRGFNAAQAMDRDALAIMEMVDRAKARGRSGTGATPKDIRS
ncbi:DUF4124 domain-containing protein [Roseateles chitinivorans]|uniref:DUF4124 domain-containing protein n=1 Tax=Roseateles chitinivorans TaxID=2917965 RepID=UPI003D6670B2